MNDPLWSNERIALRILAKGGGIKQMSIGQVAAQDIMKSMRDDMQATIDGLRAQLATAQQELAEAQEELVRVTTCQLCEGETKVDAFWEMPNVDGVVREYTCPRCKGTGKEPTNEEVADNELL